MQGRQNIRSDGFVQTIAQPLSIAQITKLIGADTLDTVNPAPPWAAASRHVR